MSKWHKGGGDWQRRLCDGTDLFVWPWGRQYRAVVGDWANSYAKPETAMRAAERRAAWLARKMLKDLGVER